MRRPEPEQALRPGDVVEAVVEKGVYRGRGLARVGGRVVFVPRAHPGDRVRARVSEVHAGWAEAAIVEVLEPSPGRRPSPCPYVPRCGGCAYQDYDDGAELRLKESVLRESLARAGAPWEGEIVRHASPAAGWRMRATLHFGRGDGAPRLGLRQEGTRRVVDVEACLQLSEPMNRAARALHGALVGRPQAARVHGLELLEAPDGSALVAVLETGLARSEAPALAELGPRRIAERARGAHARRLARVALRFALRRSASARPLAAGARDLVLPGQSLPLRGARPDRRRSSSPTAARGSSTSTRASASSRCRSRRASGATDGRRRAVGASRARTRSSRRAAQGSASVSVRTGRRRGGASRRSRPSRASASCSTRRERAPPARSWRPSRRAGRTRSSTSRAIRQRSAATSRCSRRGGIGPTPFTSSTCSRRRSIWRRWSACSRCDARESVRCCRSRTTGR